MIGRALRGCLSWGVALVLSGCATFANLTGLPDVTVCKRVGVVWKATLEECKA